MAGAIGGSADIAAGSQEYLICPASPSLDPGRHAPRTPRSAQGHFNEASDPSTRRMHRAAVHPQILAA
eukprot:8130835-Pyramimonas_sp.AAC.1